MTQKSLKVTWHDHLQHLSGLFQDLYENKKLIDVTLYCTGGALKAHKIVLSACSPYFAKIFEEHDFKHPIIILKGITFNEMHLLLEFMYKGCIHITENELDSLIQAGSYLEIKGMDVKNIPIGIKTNTKRLADTPITDLNEVAKRLKENLEKNTNSDSEQINTEETVEDVSKSDNNSNQIESSPSHNRDTRFKGKKRVDVHMFARPFKGKLNVSDIQNKSKEKPSEKNKQIEKDKSSKTISQELIGRLNDEDVEIFANCKKAKLYRSAPTTPTKNMALDQKRYRRRQLKNEEEKYEMNLVIKDVYSTLEHQVNSLDNKDGKSVPSAKNAAVNEKDTFTAVIPDVVINVGDSEINCGASDTTGCFSDIEDDYDDLNDDDQDGNLNIHFQINPLECSHCKETFKTDEEIQTHIKSHNKTHKCKYCDSYFLSQSHLTRHVRTHTGEKPYSCRECGKCFSREDKLKQHIKKHDEHEYKPSPHLKKLFEVSDGPKRGRGRPRKNPVPESYFERVEKPTVKRSRGRPRKYSLPTPGEQVENYDITNLPFGDFSYLTSPLPMQNFNDVTITPVSHTENKTPQPQNESNSKAQITEIKPVKENQEETNAKDVSLVKNLPSGSTFTPLVDSVKRLNDLSIFPRT